MRKLRLEAEDLLVESFDTRGLEAEAGGTVFANDDRTEACSCRYPSCIATACVDDNGGCMDPTCRS